ncbi:MAG: hypothetical protein LBD59_08525, partial [Prevotellaceae bacterium]|nr:hypothetical protein [Prevotellaceae bacterium]
SYTRRKGAVFDSRHDGIVTGESQHSAVHSYADMDKTVAVRAYPVLECILHERNKRERHNRIFAKVSESSYKPQRYVFLRYLQKT